MPDHDPSKMLQAVDGAMFASSFPATLDGTPDTQAPCNPLESFFNARTTGRGIWKWLHYFEIYHRHFQKFVGKPCTLVEVGVYSGGSLDMWRDYFGPQCSIVGIDIDPACKSYKSEGTRIFIGDQADRAFWHNLREQVPRFDIVIDDGGHETHQQIVTLEETLPYLSAGGVYLCEDIHHSDNAFASYVNGLVRELHAYYRRPDEKEGYLTATPFQRAIHSIHTYPYVTVIERREHSISQLTAPKHGTEWQPLL